MTTALSDDQFVGYTFNGPPERRSRLWFIDRMLYPLLFGTPHFVTKGDETGIWTSDYPNPDTDDYPIPGAYLRYQHLGRQAWISVWHLTDTTIRNVHTFGHDDVWRLAVWPD